MANGITIPVSFEVMQSSIASLQKTLSNLKPNSTGFKALQDIISGIRTEMDRLTIQTSKPFINQTQFTRAERSVNNIEESFRKAEIAMSRLNFSDLKLDASQETEWKRLNQDILNIKNSINKVKDEAKKSLIYGADTKNIIADIDLSAETKTFDQLVKVIQNKTKQVKDVYEKAEEEMREAERAAFRGESARGIFNSKGNAQSLSDALGLSTYEKFFSKNGHFKDGKTGSNRFADYLKEQYGLTETDVKAIRDQNAGAVKKLLADTDSDISKALSRTVSNGEKANALMPELKAKLDERKAAQEEMIALNARLAQEQQKVQQATEAQRSGMDAAQERVRAFENSLTSAAQKSKTFETANEQSVQGLQQLREALDQGNVAFQKFSSQTQTFNSLKMAVANFMSFRQVLNIVKNGVREAANHIKELDSVMNGIAIVTDMTTNDLWKQVDTYSAMAQRYGVSIKGAYDVSKIYYQQGLETADVMTLTNETLKLSKISGMDYATATDYMTTAVRGFKMEMSEASTVVDVYSALAANTAVSQEELSIAMSKTAASMQGVGATFEEASAMIGTMVAVTRESATNIGSAMKSIASRYGELTKDPMALLDSEGEVMSFNKVDTALQSVGISMKTVDGQFRDFTDVIIELGEKWHELDSTQQRYIATQFAGNRQQSRFLALVSNVDLLKNNIEVAESSQDTGTVQTLKSLDSIQTKLEQVNVAYQQFYTTIGAETVWKNTLDGLRNYIDTLNGLPKAFGKIPVSAVAMIADAILLIKDLATQALQGIANIWPSIFPAEAIGKTMAQALADNVDVKEQENLANAAESALTATQARVEAAQESAEATKQEAEALQQIADIKSTNNTSEGNILQLNDNINSRLKTIQNDLSIDYSFDLADNSIQEQADHIVEEFKNEMDQSLELKEYMTKALQIGSDVGRSLIIGMLSQVDEARASAEQLGSAVEQGLRTILNIHSPSPTIIAMIQDGVGNAVAIGLEASSDVVIKAANDLGLQVNGALNDALEDGDKINLNDWFLPADVKPLFKNIIQEQNRVLHHKRTNMISSQEGAHRNAVNAAFFGTPEQQKKADEKEKYINDKIAEYEKEIAKLNNLMGRVDNIQYENISSQFMIATHNFDPEYLTGMAGWGGRMPSPSVALQSKDAKFRDDFGGRSAATAYMPYKFANPELGLSYLYTGDAYTPVIKAGSKTYEEARASLDEQPEIDLQYFQSRLTQFLRDAIHVPNLEIAQEHLDKVAALPYGEDGYRSTITRDKQVMADKEQMLTSLASYYLTKGQFMPKGSNFNIPLSGAELSGKSALSDALYRTIEQVIGQNISSELESNILKNNLYTSFKNKAQIDVASQFQDSNAIGVLEEALDFMHLIKNNPSLDWMEIKPKGDVRFSDLPAFSAPRGYEEELQAAFNATDRLDPRRTFMFNPQIMEGPTSKEAIDNYIRNNIPGAAFGAHGEQLVTGDLPEILNFEQLHQALSNSDLGIDELTQGIIEEAAAGLADNDLGTVFLNSLKASLSNVDFSSADIGDQINEIIRFFTSTIENENADFGIQPESGVGRQIIAGLILGMQAGLPEAVATTSNIGQEVIQILKSSLGVSSPSVYAIQDGQFLMLGLKEGIDQEKMAALQAAEAAGKAIIAEFDDEFIKTPEGLSKFIQLMRDKINQLSPELQKPFLDALQNISIDEITGENTIDVDKEFQEKVETIEETIKANKELKKAKEENIKVDNKAQEVIPNAKDNIKDINAIIRALKQYKKAREAIKSGDDTDNIKKKEADAIKFLKENGYKNRNIKQWGDKTLDKEISSQVALANSMKKPAVKQAVESTVPPEKSGQLMFDLNNLGPENTIITSIQLDEEKSKENVEEGISNIAGQVSMDDLFRDQSVITSESIGEVNDKYYEQLQLQQQLQDLKESNPALGAIEENKILQEQEEIKKRILESTFKNIDAIDEEAKQKERMYQQEQQQEQKKSIIQTATEWTQDHSRSIMNTARALSMLSGTFKSTSETGQKLAGSIQLVSGALKILTSFSGGGITAFISGAIAIYNAIEMMVEDDTEKLERLTKEAQELSDAAKVAKVDYNTLEKTSKKYEELKEKRYDSAEASEAYQEAVDDLTSKFPELILSFDNAGNAILNEVALTDTLTAAREKSAKAAYDAAKAEIEVAKLRTQGKLGDAKTAIVTELTSQRSKAYGATGTEIITSDYKSNEEIKSELDTYFESTNLQTYEGWKKAQESLLGIPDALQEMSAFIARFYTDGFDKYLSDKAFTLGNGGWNNNGSFNLQQAIIDLNNYIEQNNNDENQTNIEEAKLLLRYLNGFTNEDNTIDYEQQLKAIQKINASASNLYNVATNSESTAEQIQTAYTSFSNVLDEFAEQSELGLEDKIKEIRKNLVNGVDALRELSEEDLKLRIKEEELINSELRSTVKSTSPIESSTGIFAIMNNQLKTAFNSQKKDGEKDLATYLDNLNLTDDLITPWEDFYGSLSSEGQKAFESMLSDQKYYNAEDIIAKFGDKLPQQLNQAIETYYNEYESKIDSRLQENIKFSDTNHIRNAIYRQDKNIRFTLGDETLINSLYDQYEELNKYGRESSATYDRNAGELLNVVLKLDGTAAAFVEKTFEKYGYTQEGFQKASAEIAAQKGNKIEGLTDAAITSITSSLDTMSEQYISSVSLRIQAIQDEFTSSWKDMESNFSSAQSGMDITSAQKWLESTKQYFNAADQFQNLELTDLNFRDGKFYATIDQIAALRNGYIKEYKTQLDNQTKILENVRDNAKTETYAFRLAKYAEQVGLKDKYFVFNETKKEYDWLIEDEDQRAQAREAIASAAEQTITEANEQATEIVDRFTESLIYSLQSSLNITDYLNAERTDAQKTNFKEKLINFLQTKFSDVAEEEIEKLADEYISSLEEGGSAASNALKELIPDASASDLEKAFSYRIDDINAALDRVNSLSVGTLTTGTLRTAIENVEQKLKEANAEIELIDQDGVIQSVDYMVEIYNELYQTMSTTAGRTVAGLNSAYAQLLSAQDQINIDITDALKNGNGMSYDAFGELLAKYNIQMEDYLRESSNVIERDGFGNIRIIDWERFAKDIFKTENLDAIRNTDEYLSAFKAYNDGLIDLNKKTEDAIVEEIKQIEGAKAGDQINLSALWLKVTDIVNKAIENVEPEWYNGNVKNLGRRIRVPGEVMQEWFPEDQFSPDDYSTIYGESFASREFMGTLENIGMTFANLTEEGEGVTDLADYVHDLFTEAVRQAGGADKVTAAMIKALDANQRNLLLNIEAYDNSLSASEVLEKEYEKAIELHERDADASWFGHLQDKLKTFGATFEDGILKLEDGANLIGIAETLSEMTEVAGLEIGNGLEQVKDSVKAVLDSIREAISKGIKGGLTNTEASDLQKTAESMGIKNLQFIQTEEGLKLSNKSARDLYNTLRAIDTLQGELLFSELRDSLIKTEDQFKTIQDTQAHINELRAQIEDPNNADRIKSLQDELELAERINMTRSAEMEDDSFKFMEGKIPDAQNNPLNYWKNWGQAFEAMKAAGKASGKAKNTIGYEDFYNIVTEIGRLADLSGKAVTLGEHTVKNSQQAADLITEAAGALKNVNGEMKIDLSKINIDFSSGLDKLGEQIDGQVDALANSQIHMLDAIIAVLEIIVAMEKLKDLDVNQDLTLDFSELGIEVNDDGTIESVNTNLEGTVKDLLGLEATLEDGTSVLDAVTLQSDKFNVTMREFLEHYRDVPWLNEKGITGDMYKTFFSNMLQLVSSPDWLDSAKDGSNFFEMMNRLDWGNLVIGVDTGDVTLKMGNTGNVSVEWANANYAAYRRAYDQEKEKLDKEIQDDLQKDINKESATSDGLSATTNTKVKILNNIVVEVTDENGNLTGKYTIAGHPGKEYSDKTLATAVAELYEQKATEIDDTQWTTKGIVKGKVLVGSAEFEVESKGGDAKYTFNGETGKSATEAFNKFITQDAKKDKFGLFDKDGAINQESARYKELKVKYGLDITPIITNTLNGRKVQGNINTDTNLRNQINQFIQDKGADGLKFDDSGKAIEIPIADGVTYTIPKASLQYEGATPTADSLYDFLNAALGIDLGLKDTISQAISSAFEDLPKTLNNIKADSLQTVASALSSIVSSAMSLAGIPWETIQNGLNGFTVQNLTITAADNLIAGDPFTVTNGDLKSIDAENAVAQLSKLGINSVQSLYAYTEGMTLPEGEQNFGTITATNVVAILSALAINKVNSLINNAQMPAAQDWGSITAEVSATLSMLNITGIDNFRLSIGAMLKAAGKELTVPMASAIVSQLNILNTSGELKSNETFTVTGITNAEGKAATLKITKIEGEATVDVPSNIKTSTDNINAHAGGTATVSAEKYEIKLETVDAETGEITISTITVPADLKFGEAGSLEAYLKANPGNVTVTTTLDNTIQEQLNQQEYTIDVNTKVKDSDLPTGYHMDGDKAVLEYDNQVNPYEDGFDPWAASDISNDTAKAKIPVEVEFEEEDISIEDLIEPESIQEAGKQLPAGVAIGEKENAHEMIDVAGEGAQDTLDKMEEVFEEQSPSRKTQEMGAYLDEGLALGIQEKQEIAKTAASELGKVVIESLKESLETITECIAIIEKLIEKINSINDLKPKINIDKTSVDAASGAMDTLISKMTPQQATYTVNVEADPIPAPPSNANATYTINVVTHYSSSGGGCFVAGTKIYMADGTVKNIEDVYLNDVVIAYNPQTNEFIPKKVINGYTHHNTARIVEVTFSDGTVLKMTPSHPILTTKGWRSLDPIISLDEHGVLPGWLEIGDKVIGYYDEVEVINIQELSVPRNFDTYDFEVEECHTFLAEGIPVHNAKVAAPVIGGRGGGVGGKGKAKGSPTWLNPMGETFAKGNISGQALAGGRQRTLMGELGPELYVSGGRYFVAGQNGAEFVNLPDDAIVFNHMQTKSLMSKGQTGHGKPVTSERNAISWAKGNFEGPAMASASAALAALKQLRAMWQSLRAAKVSDLAGGAGGGGGGGGGNKSNIVDPKAWVDTVERWYNLTQKIAELEQEITYQQTIRKKLESDWEKSGASYYQSQKKSLNALEEEIAAQEELNVSRQEYFNKRVEALKGEKLGDIYEFDPKTGQMSFRKDVNINGKQGGMEFLTDLYGFNNLGKANYTNKEKYDILMKAGFGDYMKYDSNGMEIKVEGEQEEEDWETFYEKATQAFRDRLDDYNDATQSLHDEIEKGNEELEKQEAERNALLKEIRDNQIEVENKILETVVEIRQRAIDELQDTRDALEDSTQKYIDGLTNALEKEREMYETQENQNELDRKQRQLAILQRSGGSASEINALQEEINTESRDQYFNLQQQQIDAIQEASDLQIERLDRQIEIMNETLEYEKAHGLLWGQVYDVMRQSEVEIAAFITGNSSEFWSKSPLQSKQDYEEYLFKATQWVEYAKDVDTIATETANNRKERNYTDFDNAMKAEYGNNYDPNGVYKKAFLDEYAKVNNLSEATDIIRKKYHDEVIAPQEEARRKAEAEAAAAAASAPAPSSSGGSGGSSSKSSGSKKQQAYTFTTTDSRGYSTSQGGTVYASSAEEARKKAAAAAKEMGRIVDVVNKKKARGGYVGHGIYELGEQGTETVLTAQQTQILRNNILSSRPNSLISLLKTYNEGFSQNKLSLYAEEARKLREESNNSGITIENATVNMNVQQISNDYDARRAGEQAMNEIMRIARKTSAANSIRR